MSVENLMFGKRAAITFGWFDGIIKGDYRYDLQRALYASLLKEITNGSSDKDEAQPKHFVFSWILGLKYVPEEKSFVCGEKIPRLYIGSAHGEIVDSILANVLKNGGLTIQDVFIPVTNTEILPPPPGKDSLLVKALAPIVAYTTLTDESNGRKKTWYVSPYDSDFEAIIRRNIFGKAKRLGLPKGHFEINPVLVSEKNHVVAYYKDVWMHGWTGFYRIEGSPHLLDLALVAGIGANNSKGFGFVLEVSEEEAPKLPPYRKRNFRKRPPSQKSSFKNEEAE